MKHYIFSVAEPCNASWAEMTPVEQGRYCLQCEKKVVDFSGMTDAEMIRYFEKHGKVCGRFASTQLNREVYIPKQRSLMPATLLAGALSLLMPESGQAQTRQISGVIRDAISCEPIPGVIVQWGKDKTTASRVDGTFSIEVPKDSLANLKLDFKFIGYKEQVLDYTADKPLDVAMCQNVQGLTEVVIIEHSKKKKKKRKDE
jgi:hypothetical protein